MLKWALGFAGFLMACAARSEVATLTWDDRSDPNVAGYRLYYGITSGSYPFVIDVGPTTSCAVPSNLLLGMTYHFVVTAYNHFGTESEFSSEIVYTPRLRIASMFADDYGTGLMWATEPGAFYRVVATPTLTNHDWTDVSGPLLAVSATRLWTHIRARGVGSMFYRVEVLSGVR